MSPLVSAGKNLLYSYVKFFVHLYSYVKFFVPYSYVKFFDLSLERGHSHGSHLGTWWQSLIAAYALCVLHLRYMRVRYV